MDVKTEEVVAMEVTIDDERDSRALPTLIKEGSKHMEVFKAYQDSAYDSSKTYECLEGKGI